MNPITLEEFLRRLKAKFGNIIEYVGDYKNMRTKCWFRCTICGHLWNIRPVDILNSLGCPKCVWEKVSKEKMTPLEDMLEMLKVTWGDLIIYVDGYEGMSKKCHWKCKIDGYEWFATPSSVINCKNGCKKCALEYTASLKRLTEEEYSNRVYEESGHKISYISGFKCTRSRCKHKCNVCGHEWEAIASNMLYHRSGCPVCNIEHIKSLFTTPLQDFILKLEKINPNIEYVSGFVNVDTYCLVRCRICGHEWFVFPSNILYHGQGCPVCIKKSMEKPILEILKNKGINYLHNVPLKGSNYNGSRRALAVDFIIETDKGKLAIEADGRQHFYPMYGEDELKFQQEKDRHKDKYLKEHGYVFVRITSSSTKEWGFPNHIIMTKFFELLDESTDENGNVDIDVFKPYDFNRE